MKRLSILALSLACIVQFPGCGFTTNSPPPVTTAMTRANRADVDLATLREGRALFVHRCIECHTLPQFWHYRSEDWPGILDSMAHRARLTSRERHAILAYIRAARSAE
jgi:hypothetical protein